MKMLQRKFKERRSCLGSNFKNNEIGAQQFGVGTAFAKNQFKQDIFHGHLHSCTYIPVNHIDTQS